MRYELVGDSDNPIAKLSLSQGEKIRMDRGSMVYMQDVTIEGKMNAKQKGLGGVLSSIGRSLTSGESMFITEATGTSNNATIAVAPNIPGKIIKLSLGFIFRFLRNSICQEKRFKLFCCFFP